MKRAIQKNRGVTLLELLVVVTIIGILVLIGLPNWTRVIMMHRIRTTANDLAIKVRYMRATAIRTRRNLRMHVNPTARTLWIERMGHTEYDLLQDIAGAVSKGETLDDEYKLYEEDGGVVCVSHWDDARVDPDTCEYVVGVSHKRNGLDTDIVTTCTGGSGAVIFNSAGTLDQTCSFTLRNDWLGREYEIMLYRGGQVRIIQRLET